MVDAEDMQISSSFSLFRVSKSYGDPEGPMEKHVTKASRGSMGTEYLSCHFSSESCSLMLQFTECSRHSRNAVAYSDFGDMSLRANDDACCKRV